MARSNSFQKDQHVEWDWGSGKGRGQVAERFERKVTRMLKGEEITRDGDSENPAYLIRQEDGGKVLKLGSELSGSQSKYGDWKQCAMKQPYPRCSARFAKRGWR